MPDKIFVKSVLNKAKQRDTWFLDDYRVNLYSGCSFNCLYCYIRGSKYGIHMERSVSWKANSIEILERQLKNRAKKAQYGIIALSSATDPYLHFEREYQLTRQALEIILKYRFPVHILTKSDLVERDFDLLKEINDNAILPADLGKKLSGGAILSFSFSGIDDEIAAVFEPGAPPPSRRLETIEKAKAHGFLTGVSLMPLLPFITDTNEHLELLFSTFKRISVDYVLPASLTLFGDKPADSKTAMLRTIEKLYPHLLEKYRRWFAFSNQMPHYYQKAFQLKMEELCAKYELRNSIDH